MHSLRTHLQQQQHYYIAHGSVTANIYKYCMESVVYTASMTCVLYVMICVLCTTMTLYNKEIVVNNQSVIMQL